MTLTEALAPYKIKGSDGDLPVTSDRASRRPEENPALEHGTRSTYVNHGCRVTLRGRAAGVEPAPRQPGSARPARFPTSASLPIRTERGMAVANRYEYKVAELREGMIGGKMSGGKLERVLNEHAQEGWQLKAITSVEIKGRVGPGGVEGVLVTFERQLA